jgi:HAE1 family hydrophobic/amphiphilic exporter-1
MAGRVGRFFSSFGMVVGFSVLTSMLVSFTMTPMLCSDSSSSREAEDEQGGTVWRAIRAPTCRSSARPLPPVGVISSGGSVLAATPAIFREWARTSSPRDDQSELEVVLDPPEGYSLERRTAPARRSREAPALRGVTHTLTTSATRPGA